MVIPRFRVENIGDGRVRQAQSQSTHDGESKPAHRFTLVPSLSTDGRVVHDRNRITGGGITAGLDFGLTVVAEVWGSASAQAAQLMLEYNPAPPFNSGSPETAPPAVLAHVRTVLASAHERRARIASAHEVR